MSCNLSFSIFASLILTVSRPEIIMQAPSRHVCAPQRCPTCCQTLRVLPLFTVTFMYSGHDNGPGRCER